MDIEQTDFSGRSSAMHTASSLEDAVASTQERPRLEDKSNNWKFEQEERHIIVRHKCDCRTCPECGKRRGYETRRVLLQDDVLNQFKEPVLLTLTVDPKRFDSPDSAHSIVTKGGYIRRLLRLLNIDVWVWVLEFQKNGWPHWHIVADVSMRGRLTPQDLKRCWRLWRDKWGIGGLDLEERKRFTSASYAMNYITKYLTKPAKNPFPAWFLIGSRRRLCQASKKVGRLTLRENTPAKDPEVDDVKQRRVARALVDRMSECGLTCIVIKEVIDLKTLKSSFVYCGKIEQPPEILCELSEAGLLSGDVDIGMEKLLRLGYATDAYLLRSKEENIIHCINGINESLFNMGFSYSLNDEIRERRDSILGVQMHASSVGGKLKI